MKYDYIQTYALCSILPRRTCLAPNPVLHMSAPVRTGAVADARLGLA